MYSFKSVNIRRTVQVHLREEERLTSKEKAVNRDAPHYEGLREDLTKGLDVVYGATRSTSSYTIFLL